MRKDKLMTRNFIQEETVPEKIKNKK